MLTIYGADFSFPVNKVRFTANKLGIDYQYKQVNLLEKEGQAPEYLALHPAGKIPAIKDGEFSLFESNAICKYLVKKENSDLYPNKLEAEARVDQWMDFTSFHLGNAIGKVTFNRVFAPRFNMEVNEASIAEGEEFLARFLPVVEAQIKTTGNLAGKDFSLADISLLATLDPVEVAEVSLTDYPSVAAWRDKLKKEKFYTDCYADFREVLQN